MTSRRKRIIIILSVLLIILIALTYFRINANRNASLRQTLPPSVQATTTARTVIINKINFTGDILAIQQANIYSRVSGNISNIYAEPGDFVTKGKLLARIDDSQYLQSLRQSEGVYKQVKATLENNKINFQRNRELFEKGLISKNELDNAETIMKVSEGQLDAAEANYRNAQIQLGYCNIRAPFSGYVTKRFLDAGAYISPGGQSQSTVILLLADIERVKVTVNVVEKDISSIDRVSYATVRIDAYPDTVFTAKVKKMSQAVDLTTRTMPVEIEIDNSRRKLKPGMFANVELILDVHENALTLPSNAVVKDDKGFYVYTLSGDSVAHKKYIQTGIVAENNTEITSGISDREIIVFFGHEFIRDGIKVKFTKREP